MSEQFLTYNNVRLSRSRWMELARRCIDREIGDNVTDMVESILDWSKDTDHGHGGHGKGLFSRHDVANFYGPEDLDDWSVRKCAEWAAGQEIPEKEWPNDFTLLLDTIVEYGHDEPDATFWSALEWAGEKSEKLHERIGPGILMSDLSRKQIKQALIETTDDWVGNRYEWLDLVEENWSSDVCEWWTCTSWFAEHARPLGLCLLELDRTWVFGRESTGETMELDESLYPIWALIATSVGLE